MTIYILGFGAFHAPYTVTLPRVDCLNGGNAHPAVCRPWSILDRPVEDQSPLVDEQHPARHAATSCNMCVDSKIVLLWPNLRIVSRTSCIWFGSSPAVARPGSARGLVEQDLGHAHPLPISPRKLADRFADNAA